MSQKKEDIGKLSTIKKAFLALEEAEAKLKDMERSKSEPIAIIGMGCRFPGNATSPEKFWRNLIEGCDSITEIPTDRWDINQYYDPNPETPGKMSTRWGGFIEDIDKFDNNFFGITPREARSMDPQQRLLMEVAWQALEDAGYGSLPALENSQTGVFVGISTDDYAQLLLEEHGLAGLDTYFASGVARSIASGRLSYQFGLRGPAISIDTACSSSLVAVHQACRSLLYSECKMALAGGINLILSPVNTITLSKYQMMAPDGKCKVFDSSANGFVRGEGCGIVVLKRLKDAQKDGDHIYATILGSAMNQDGPSSGLTAPNGPSQEAVISEALRQARVEPKDVSFIETHGTGTALGDPIEVQALGSCYSEGRSSADPLIIGSVKTNIGHLEAASGIAGLIKTALVLYHGEIPPNLHFNTPNPQIPWERYTLQVPTKRLPLGVDQKNLLAGVTGLGFSGTNVHMILSSTSPSDAENNRPAISKETYYSNSTQAAVTPPLQLIPLSANDQNALMDKAKDLINWLDGEPEPSLGDIALTLGAGRSHGMYRHVMLENNCAKLRQSLVDFLKNSTGAANCVKSLDSDEQPKVAFLFTGQGSQYPNMGRELDQSHSEFRAIIDQCDELMKPMLGQSIRDILFPDSSAEKELIHETQYAQPALFVLEYALAHLWFTWGVKPSFVLGHSLGEYTAACIAGILPLEDALTLVVNRARLMQSMDSNGAMHAILAPEEQVIEKVSAYADTVSVAAYNGPEHVVISGEQKSVEAVSTFFDDKGYLVRPLQVSHAFHSPMIRPMLDQFEEILAEIAFKPPRIRLVSNLSGKVVNPEEITTPAYWRKHAENSVHFKNGIQTIAQSGCRLFIEIGPHPVLSGMGRHCLPEEDIKWLPSLHNQHNDWQCVLESLAQLYLGGFTVNWENLSKPFNSKKISLPFYPFQRKRFWFNPASSSPVERTSKHIDSPLHPLSDTRTDSATGKIYFRSQLEDDRTAFFKEHCVSGISSLPIAAVLEAAFRIAELLFKGQYGIQVHDLSMDHMIALSEDGPTELEWVIEPEGEARYRFKLFSRGADANTWQQNAAGVLSSGNSVSEWAIEENPIKLKDRHSATLTADTFYEVLDSAGLDFGPSFRPLQNLWIGDCEALGSLQEDSFPAMKNLGYSVSPLMIDGALQVIAGTYANLQNPAGQLDLYLPVGIDRFEIHTTQTPGKWGYAVLSQKSSPGSKTLKGDVFLLDNNGDPIVSIRGCRLLAVDLGTFTATHKSITQKLLYQIQWVVAQNPEQFHARDLAQVAIEVDAIVPEVASKHDLQTYETDAIQMDKLVQMYIQAAFRKLGWKAQPNDYIDPAMLSDQLGIDKRYGKLVNHYLKMLAHDELLTSTKDGWRVEKQISEVDAVSFGNKIAKSDTLASVEVALINRCGSQLAETLKGDVDPLDLLFSSEAFPLVTKLYRETTVARLYNSLVYEFISRFLHERSDNTALRILEIGGGTGGTTQSVLDAAEGLDYEYLFTDISQAFVNAAERRFQEQNNFHAEVFDLEKNPKEQGLSGRQFDLIIAANVIHATADLTQTMQYIHSMTAPGGVVLMIEVTAPQGWIDLTFALTEGWWKFTDNELRLDYPLVGVEQWKQILNDTGFEDFAMTPKPEAYPAGSILATESIIAARRPLEPNKKRNCLVFCDESDLGPQLADRLATNGFVSNLVSRDTKKLPANQFITSQIGDTREAFKSMLRSFNTESTGHYPSHIIYLWGLTCPDEHVAEDNLLAYQQHMVSPLLHLYQALAEETSLNPPKVTVVTRSAQTCDPDHNIDPQVASLWGLVRAVMLEHPEFKSKLIDLPAERLPDEAESIVREIRHYNSEDQILIRDGQRRVARLIHLDQNKIQPHTATIQRLDTTERGVLDNLYWKDLPPVPLAEGQVRIRVHSTGLNFRDVLNALGVYADGPVPFGGECSGTIAELGPGVKGFVLGDHVMAIAPHCFSSEVVVDARLTQKIPGNIPLAEAASLPIAYTTAYYALQELADLKTGQSILIHAGAGGVGMAAVNIALQRGAEVYATAGNPEKQDYLKEKGVKEVMSSRSLTFADQLTAITNGKGVDVVLNSLAGEFIDRSLSITATGGTFIELGRTEILTTEAVREKRPDVAYYPINLTEAMSSAPETVQPMMDKITAQVEDGTLELLPCRQFQQTEVVEAFRYMAAAKHIGKIVVNWPTQSDIIPKKFSIESTGTYWITGGMGGLGLLTARWLAEKGAGHIMLTGRSNPTSAAENTIASIGQLGTQVTVMQSDVASRDQVESVLAEITTKHPPLRGIIHSAGALDDGVLQHQNWQRFKHVFDAKVAGAWHLHQASKQLDLDFFVLYSSAASLLGSPGQTNHCAANAFMDALVHARRLAGMQATSINWGAWADVGAAVKEEAVTRTALKGIDHISTETGLKFLEKLIQSKVTQSAVMAVDWGQYARQTYPDGVVPPIIADLIKKTDTEVPKKAAIVRAITPAQQKSFTQQLSECPETQRREILIDHLQRETFRILGLDETENIDQDKPLVELGLDSLMAVELRNALSNTFQQTLPATMLFDYPTLHSVCNYLMSLLGITQPENNRREEPKEEHESTDDLLKRIESMPDETIDKLINKKD